MTEMRPIRWRYGPGTSRGSVASAVLAECVIGGTPSSSATRPSRDDIHYRCSGWKSPAAVPGDRVSLKRCATIAMARRPAEGVVDPAAEHRSDRGADQHGAGDVTLGVWGQPKVVQHRPQGAVDHAAVVAGEKATECCERS